MSFITYFWSELCNARNVNMKTQQERYFAHWKGTVFPEASWGLGWNICGNKKSLGYAEMLQSSKAFSDGGSGGVFLWIDPIYEILGIYFSVASKGGITTLEGFEESFYIDLVRHVALLINTVTATITDL